MQVSRAHLADGRAAAVVLSSGNANAATGEPGRDDARAHVRADRRRARHRDRRRARVLDRPHRHPDADGAARGRHPEALRRSSRPTAGGAAAAEAILTTDTVRKEAIAEAERRGRTRSAGWRRVRRCSSPAMATMLAVLTTDAAVDAGRAARSARAGGRATTFDCLGVDGCRSHQRHRDRAGQRTPAAPIDGRTHATRVRRRAHRGVRLAGRADGARRRGRDEARPRRRASARARRPRRASRRQAVANSQLVQCSLNGGDPYWGRVLSELGASGAFLDPERVDIAYNGVTVCRDGVACDARRGAARRRSWPGARSRSAATCTRAHGEATVLTTDLSHAYIDENRRTS